MPYIPSGNLTFTKEGYSPSGDLLFGAQGSTLNATELQTDNFSSNGNVAESVDVLNAIEQSTDTYSSTGDVLITGLVGATENNTDVFLTTGSLSADGDLAAVELSTDDIFIGNLPPIIGDLSITETGTDSASIEATLVVTGNLGVTEPYTDLLYIISYPPIFGDLSSQEIENDSFLSGNPDNTGDAAITESSSDTFNSLSTLFLSEETILKQNIVCTFYGDTLPELDIPISYMSNRLKKTGGSSCDIVIPNGSKYDQSIEQFINDNGSFYIKYFDYLEDGALINTTSSAYLIKSSSSSRGGRNWSITVSGENTFAIGSSINNIKLSGVSLLRANASGTSTLRCKLDRRLLPFDRAVYDNVEYYVEKVTQVANEKNIYMEVSTG